MRNISQRILIVEDEAPMCELLTSFFTEKAYDVGTAQDGEHALARLEERDYALVITDIKLPGMSGLELLARIRVDWPEMAVVIMTAFSSISSAVEAMKLGAEDYIGKPFQLDELAITVEKALERLSLRREVRELRAEVRGRYNFSNIVGRSKPMQQLFEVIKRIAARRDAAALITGSTGTGKELVARAIHYNSDRRDAPFMPINCSAIPDTLLESELFGHQKGAFTGAVSRRHGCFELANTGTLLLDEIGEMPSLLQAKLLRVIEERVVHRLGSRKDIPIDVRILAATNKDPQEAVRDGTLREDLLYRLNVITIHMPLLTERMEDLPLLAQHLVTRLAAKHDRPARFVSHAALDALRFHSWPGNVRELRNVIERAVVICSGEQIERHHFAPYPFEQDR